MGIHDSGRRRSIDSDSVKREAHSRRWRENHLLADCTPLTTIFKARPPAFASLVVVPLFPFGSARMVSKMQSFFFKGGIFFSAFLRPLEKSSRIVIVSPFTEIELCDE